MNRTKATTTRLRVVTQPSTDLAALIDDYLAEKRAEGLSPHSISLIRSTLLDTFLPWARDRRVTVVSQETLNAWSRYLLEEHKTRSGKPLSKESIRTYMRNMKGLVGWAQKRGELGEMKVPMPKAPEVVKEVLSREEIRDMEDAASTERDKLIIRLLGDLGLRLGELLDLQTDDLKREKDERYLEVRGKGSRDRRIPLAPQLFTRLERYSRRPQAKRATTEHIFTTERKKDGAYEPLGTRAVQQMVKFTAEKAGITKRVHPHLFRHSAITWMINRQVPVDHIRRIVGHADLSLITGTYSHVQPSDLYQSMLDLIRREDDGRRR